MINKNSTFKKYKIILFGLDLSCEQSYDFMKLQVYNNIVFSEI